jgi:hypothetical protein
MSVKERYEDYSTLLYLVPFVGSIAYALALWVQSGISLELPASVFLTVTRDPIMFIVASLAVMLGLAIEVNGTEPSARPAKLVSLSSTLQSMAVASIVIALIAALYANGFTDFGGTASDFVVGKYGLIFPSILVLLSYFITAQFKVESLASRKVLALIAMLLVPASLYEIGKRQTGLGLGIAFVLLVVGLVLYLAPERKALPPQKQ